MKRTSKNGYVAPHKPILLLAIQYRIQTGWITDNNILPDKALERQFSQFWNIFVDNGREQDMVVCDNLLLESEKVYPFKCKMSYPFFQLGREPFWNLVKTKDWLERSEYSMVQMRKCFKYAEMNIELFELMKDDCFGKEIKQQLQMMI